MHAPMSGLAFMWKTLCDLLNVLDAQRSTLRCFLSLRPAKRPAGLLQRGEWVGVGGIRVKGERDAAAARGRGGKERRRETRRAVGVMRALRRGKRGGRLQRRRLVPGPRAAASSVRRRGSCEPPAPRSKALPSSLLGDTHPLVIVQDLPNLSPPLSRTPIPGGGSRTQPPFLLTATKNTPVCKLAFPPPPPPRLRTRTRCLFDGSPGAPRRLCAAAGSPAARAALGAWRAAAIGRRRRGLARRDTARARHHTAPTTTNLLPRAVASATSAPPTPLAPSPQALRAVRWSGPLPAVSSEAVPRRRAATLVLVPAISTPSYVLLLLQSCTATLPGHLLAPFAVSIERVHA